MQMPTFEVLNPPDKTDYKVETWEIRERDVDLLLMEELYSSAKFRRHFLRLLDRKLPKEMGFPQLSRKANLIGLQHSARAMGGQSDVEMEVRKAENLYMIMVENKIDAAFQPEQAKRYEERAERYRAKGYKVATVLIAPMNYLGNSTFGFNVPISYEELLRWFAKANSLGRRKVCKIALLNAALQKSKRITPRPSLDFFHAYYQLANTLAPTLRMTDDPRGGGFLYFRPANLPKYLYLMHRIRKGYVDLQFRGAADRVDRLRWTFREVLPDDSKFAV